MKIKPTNSELEILNVLWEKGSATVREVHEALNKDAGYTTTLKLMQIMFEKNLLRRDDAGKTHIYKPAITRNQIQGQMMQKMIDSVFKGSASQLVLHALGNYKTTPAELEEIKNYLKEIEQKTKK